MMTGTAAADSSNPLIDDPPPPLPKLASPGWVTPPPIPSPGTNDSERLARREANHHVYHCNGTQITWYHYVLFGYYQFNRVEDFLNAWHPVSGIESARYRIMWNTFHLHRMSNIPISPLLNMWANKYAKPYLQDNDPDFLLATEIIYDDSLENEAEKPITPELTWTEIGHKNRRDKNSRPKSPSPSSTPPPSPCPSPTMIATTEYYRPLQTDVDDVDMHDDADDEVQFIEPTNTHYISTTKHAPNTQPNESSQTATTTNPVTPSPPTTTQNQLSPMIRLRNPYRNKNKKPRNPTFAKHLRNYIATRSAINHNTNKSTTPEPPHPPNISRSPSQPTTKHPTNDVAAGITRNPNLLQETRDQNSHAANSTSNTTYQPPDPFVLINDGTQRLTIRWKPKQFEILELNQYKWDTTLVTVLNSIFHDHTSRTALVKWGEQHTPDNNEPLDTITPDKVRQYLSPNISVLKTNRTFVFGLRLCASDNHLSAWITRENTRELLRSHYMEITISNSKSSSGNVVTAGYVLMKHPIYTQRYFFLLALRKALPPHTPFFDLAIHRRTPHGHTTAHIVVKCGENHITALSEILSVYLDGHKNNTALFVASQAVKTMTQEEIGKMFSAHTKYVEDTQRLTLFPKVINIDRERAEHYDGNMITRSSREWARQLKTEHGSSLRCDVENGGPDRRAYLLVVSQHLDRAKIELHNYLQALITATGSSTDPSDRNRGQRTEPKRPTEIYIPTPAVRNNLQFLNTLTSEEVWKSAPSTIRTPPSHQQHANSNYASHKMAPPAPTKTTTATHRPPPPPTPATNPTNNTYSNATNNEQPTDFPPLNSTATRPDDTTVGTTASNFTRTTSYQNNQHAYNSKFQELEDQINSHTQEFQAIHNRFDSLNEQILRNMQIASEHSKHFSQMERQFNDMNAAIQTLLHRSNASLTTRQPATFPIHEEQSIPETSKRQGDQQGDTNSEHFAGPSSQSVASASTDSRTSVESIPISSPEKKRIRSHNPSHLSTDVQDQSAQYKESAPVDPDL